MILKNLGEYFWIVGLSLIIVGITQIFNDPLGIFISGIFIYFLGLIIKFALKDELSELNKKIDTLLKQTFELKNSKPKK